MAENEQMPEGESNNEGSESEQPEQDTSENDEEVEEQDSAEEEKEYMDERENLEDESGIEEEELTPEEATPQKPIKKKPKRLASRVLEYDIEEMYPEIELLVEKKKNEWNYQDPAIIRALWLESKTNVLADWKERNMKFNRKKKPTLEVRNTLAFTLRKDHLQEKAQKQEVSLLQIPVGNDPPVYRAVQLPTNLTMEVRYNFVRNNPPVPRWYVEHFHTYKKPPFITTIHKCCFQKL